MVLSRPPGPGFRGKHDDSIYGTEELSHPLRNQNKEVNIALSLDPSPGMEVADGGSSHFDK